MVILNLETVFVLLFVEYLSLLLYRIRIGIMHANITNIMFLFDSPKHNNVMKWKVAELFTSNFYMVSVTQLFFRSNLIYVGSASDFDI